MYGSWCSEYICVQSRLCYLFVWSMGCFFFFLFAQLLVVTDSVGVVFVGFCQLHTACFYRTCDNRVFLCLFIDLIHSTQFIKLSTFQWLRPLNAMTIFAIRYCLTKLFCFIFCFFTFPLLHYALDKDKADVLNMISLFSLQNISTLRSALLIILTHTTQPKM